MRYVLSYDVENDKQRNKIAKILLDYGERAQFSVFEAALDAAQLARLRDRVVKALDAKNDSFIIYPLCEKCSKNIQRIGARREDPLNSDGIKIV